MRKALPELTPQEITDLRVREQFFWAGMRGMHRASRSMGRPALDGTGELR